MYVGASVCQNKVMVGYSYNAKDSGILVHVWHNKPPTTAWRHLLEILNKFLEPLHQEMIQQSLDFYHNSKQL